MTTIPSQTLLLFESGATMNLFATVHEASGEKRRTIDAYIVTPLGQEFEDSALRGAESVYLAIRNHPMFPEKFDKQLTVAYDLKKPSGNHGYTGHSAELGFALGLAKSIFDHDPGPIGATGVIDNVSAGTLHKVGGIDSKLNGAARELAGGGKIFFPAENEAEISDATRKSLEEKDISLHPVHTVHEAIRIMFPTVEEAKAEDVCFTLAENNPQTPIIRSLVLSLMLTIVIVGGWLYLSRVLYPGMTYSDLFKFKTYSSSQGYEHDQPIPVQDTQRQGDKPPYE